MNLHGINIYETTTMCRQFRFPASKKRRIRNKWAQRPCNWKPITDSGVLVQGKTLICHPVYAAKLRAQIPSINSGN
jgi:hypothetical protein